MGDIAVRDGDEAVRIAAVPAGPAGRVTAGTVMGTVAWLAGLAVGIRELRRQRRFGFVWPTAVGARRGWTDSIGTGTSWLATEIAEGTPSRAPGC
ncbi:MAG: hypothetical protein P8L85_23810 [Rubripirellula sp.]|nr:hypothetical protein [Rubripirellula sp.]